jgi:D-alanyl-D-alanine carboxypeptidase
MPRPSVKISRAYPDVWDYNNRHQSFAPLASAIALNGNLVEVQATPGTQTGQAGRIVVYPESHRSASSTTRRPPRERYAACMRDSRPMVKRSDRRREAGPRSGDASRSGAAGASAGLHPGPGRGRAQGRADRGAGRRPHCHRSGQAEALQIERVLARHESPPLTVLLDSMGQSSDNFVAEQLWLAAAHRATGLGVRSNARRYEQSWLAAQGLPWIEPGYDGSGLSRLNQISAAEQVAVLEASTVRPMLRMSLHSLAQSGRTARSATGDSMPFRAGLCENGHAFGRERPVGFHDGQRSEGRAGSSRCSETHGETRTDA